MFPPSVRRSLRVLTSAGVAAALIYGPAAASGAASAATAASVIAATKTAMAKQTGVHIVVTENAGKTKTKVVVDLGKATGTETITTGKKYVSIIVTTKFAYVRGSLGGLTGIMGLTAKQAGVVGTKSIVMDAGSTPYTSFKTSLTTGALQSFLPKVKGTTLLPVLAGSGSYRIRWSVKSSSSGAKVTSTLTIKSNRTSLPVSETVTSTTGAGSTTFTHWGETPYLLVPNPSNLVTYTKVFAG
jgi:hypothetical protein